MPDHITARKRKITRLMALIPLGLALAAGTACSDGNAETGPGRGRYHLHGLGIDCTVGPCPDYQVKDRRTGEVFHAVLDIARVARRLPNGSLFLPGPFGLPGPSGDLIVEANRAEREHPVKGRAPYTVLTLTAIVGSAGAADWNRPPRPTEARGR